MSTHAFTYTDKNGVLTAIDGVSPQTGLSYWFGKTQQQLEQEYGAPVTVMTWEEYDKRHQALFIQPPDEITEGEYRQALEVLPPDDWQHAGDTESFKMCEHMTGPITGIYARIGERFFAMTDNCHMAHAAIIAACRAYIATADRLFIGSYPCGIVYADMGRTVAGDYARVAFLPYNTLRFEPGRDADPALLAMAKAHAERNYKPGQELQISQCGQSITLGAAIEEANFLASFTEIGIRI